MNIILNKKKNGLGDVKFKYKRPTVKEWTELADANIPVHLDKDNNVLQLKAKKVTEIDSCLEVLPPKDGDQIIALGIEYNPQSKIWEIKLKKPLLDNENEPPTVNVTMGDDRRE